MTKNYYFHFLILLIIKINSIFLVIITLHVIMLFYSEINCTFQYNPNIHFYIKMLQFYSLNFDFINNTIHFYLQLYFNLN